MRNLIYRLLAALMFFTRLPLWKLANVDKKYFERVVPVWHCVGLMTGGLMALVYWLCSIHFSLGVSVMVAIVARVLLTGALHEDGFADFCDGFGGGTSRQRTLDIMKDSHIGTYGVLGLILYYGLLFSTMTDKLADNMLLFIAADVYSKFATSNIINVLPYARNEENAKNKLVYKHMTLIEWVIGFVVSVCVVMLCCPMNQWIALVTTPAAAAVMFAMMHKKIGGYTGDCCGATFMVCELVFWLSL